MIKAKFGKLIIGFRIRKIFKWLSKQNIGRETLDLLRIKNDIVKFAMKNKNNGIISSGSGIEEDPFIQNITK